MATTEERLTSLEDQLESIETTISSLTATITSDVTTLTTKISNTTGGSITNISCNAVKLLPSLTTMVSMQQTMNENMEITKDEVVELSSLAATLASVMTHIHNSHYHCKPHDCNDGFDVDNGYHTLPPLEGAVTRLMAELMTGVDKDENGMICGVDFYLDPDDENLPLGVKDCYLVMETIPKVKMTWAEYRATLPDNVPL